MRVLALDHYFDQDLRALEDVGLDVRRVPFLRWRAPAVRMLGGDVATGLEAYAGPGLAAARERYARWLARDVERLYLERAFDVVVLPSDVFFYVRALPDAAHRIGVPVVVVQKETAISPDTLRTHSEAVRLHAPFVSDLMTVCSEAHRAFWLAAGADPERVVVTGQPRFDAYAHPPPRRPGPRRVLFLSYELDAYEPGVGGGAGRTTWGPLRAETERALVGVTAAGVEVTVKLHPQQQREGELRRLAGVGGMSVADPEADTRLLMLDADVVVGFQTTGLYEAVAAGRPAVYAAWGDAYEAHREGLLPLDRAPASCVRRARGPDDLAALLTGELPAPPASCRPWFEEVLGPVDGGASRRVAELLAETASAWPPGSERLALDRARRRHAAGALLRTLAVETVWTAATLPAAVAGRSLGVRARRDTARARRRMVTEALRGR